jgi:hypothetical protein
MAPQGADSLSLLVQCWHDPRTGWNQLRVERIDTREEVHLNDSTLLIRVAIDRGRPMERCLIRHIASGREAYVQGGPSLSGFIRDCLVAPATPGDGVAKEQQDA